MSNLKSCNPASPVVPVVFVVVVVVVVVCCTFLFISDVPNVSGKLLISNLKSFISKLKSNGWVVFVVVVFVSW